MRQLDPIRTLLNSRCKRSQHLDWFPYRIGKQYHVTILAYSTGERKQVRRIVHKNTCHIGRACSFLHLVTVIYHYVYYTTSRSDVKVFSSKIRLVFLLDHSFHHLSGIWRKPHLIWRYRFCQTLFCIVSIVHSFCVIPKESFDILSCPLLLDHIGYDPWNIVITSIGRYNDKLAVGLTTHYHVHRYLFLNHHSSIPC